MKLQFISFPSLFLFYIFLFSAQSSSSQVFTLTNYKFYISDNSVKDTSVGYIVANDEDEIAYSLTTGNTNNTFKINENTGELTITKRLNHHAQNKFNLTIRATKAGGGFIEAEALIVVYPGVIHPSFTTITWSNVANQPVGTHEVHGKVVGGKLFIFGGYDVNKQPDNWTPTKRSYVYDPVSNNWSAIADLPHNPKGSGFGGITHQGIASDDTDIFFAGGYPSNADGTGQVFGSREVWRYNVATNNYTALPDLPEHLAAGQLEYLAGKIHYMGGANLARHDVAVHYALDLDNLDAGWTSLAPLPSPRNHPGSAVYEGKIYFIGGAHHQDQATVTQNRVDVYDPETNTWTRVADIPTARDHISSSVVVMGERILVLGGETSHNVRSNLVSAYTPATNTWAELTPLPISIGAGVAAVLNWALHYTGGDFLRTNRKGTYPGFDSQPVVNISKPLAQEFFPVDSPIIIEVEATVKSGTIAKVEFYADEVKLGEDINSPYTFSWSNANPGTYHIIAKAINDKGAISNSSAVRILVQKSNIPPIVTITSPANGAKFIEGTEIVITAEASDEDGSIQRVEFYNDNTKLGEVSSPPFQFSWNEVPPGIYDLRARAFDNLGASTYSSVATIEVLGPDSPPVISITSPAAGSNFEEGGDIVIEIEALDPNNQLSSIEIFQNGIILVELTSSPYSFNWENVPEGSYELSAIAHTAEGEAINSETVDIEVLPSVLTRIQDNNLSISVFNIYPIPSSGNINVEFKLNKNDDTALDIYNVQGLLIDKIYSGKAEAGNLHKFEIDGINLKNGIYFIRLTSGTNLKLKKIILNK